MESEYQFSRAAFSAGVASAASPSRDGLALAPRFKVAFDDAAACLERRFIRDVLRQRGLQRDEVVGQQARAGVPDLELDALGAPGHFGLLCPAA